MGRDGRVPAAHRSARAGGEPHAATRLRRQCGPLHPRLPHQRRGPDPRRAARSPPRRDRALLRREPQVGRLDRRQRHRRRRRAPSPRARAGLHPGPDGGGARRHRRPRRRAARGARDHGGGRNRQRPRLRLRAAGDRAGRPGLPGRCPARLRAERRRRGRLGGDGRRRRRGRVRDHGRHRPAPPRQAPCVGPPARRARRSEERAARTTTSLQASKLGQGIYARLGYRPLGEVHLYEKRPK